MGLSWLQPIYFSPVIGDVQHHDGERIRETSNGDHVGIVLEPCILLSVTYIFIALYFQCNLYHSAKSEMPGNDNSLQKTWY